MNTYTRLSLVLLLGTSSWQLGAQTAAVKTEPANPPASDTQSDELLILSPFEVTSEKDTGYQATETLGGTRIRTSLKDVGSSLSVVTKGFLDDVGATNSASLLQYTTNTEVSGTLGTYAGLGNGQTPNEQSTLRRDGYVNRVRGLAAAENTRDFFSTDIPWDGFDVDRVELQRGANSIMFGLGSPGGIINTPVNNATFTTKGEASVRYGSYGSMRGSLNYNQVLIDNELALRVAGLADDEKYQQKPAYQNDHRLFAALRYDPKLIKAKGFNTSIKAKYEAGDIKANRPRILPPYDQITPWFKAVDQDAKTGLYSANSGLGKVGVNYPADVVGTSNPWIGQTAANQQQPIWFVDGNTTELYRIFGGFVNRGAISNKGVAQGSSASLTNQKYGDIFPGIRASRLTPIRPSCPAGRTASTATSPSRIPRSTTSTTT